MAQSYSNFSFTPIPVPVDSIVGINQKEQQLGTSISGVTGEALPSALTLEILLDGDGSAQTISVQGNQPYDVAAAIQAAVRLLTPNGTAPASAFTGFTCRYDNHLSQYILASGTSPSATSSCLVTGGTAASVLDLGSANGGTESYTGHEVITYWVKYQFVFNAGAYYGSATVLVSSSDMSTPTSMVQLMALANERAAQMKEEIQSSFYPYTKTTNNSQNGPAPF